MNDVEDKVNPYRTRVNRYPHKILINSYDPPPARTVERIKEHLASFDEIICELGSGSGRHLIERAALQPKVAFVGVELRFKRTVRTIEKAEERNIHNVFVLRTKAQYLADFFSPHSLTGLYMNFPDPWEKRNEKKHRMFSATFLEQAKTLLHPEKGFIALKTDHRGYWEDACSLVKQCQDFVITAETSDLHKSIYKDDNVLTEFEKLFLSQGLPIYLLKLSLKQQR